MENLPSDIIENILFRLPSDTALHAKHVCTTWKAILRNYKSHKPGYLFAFNLAVVGSIVEQQLFYGDGYDRASMNCYNTSNTLSKIRPYGRFITKFSLRNIMVGSCNGLVCFGKGKTKDAPGAVPFLICNPLTGESVLLSEFNYSELPRDISTTNLPRSCLASGFGYCPSTNEYKVVTIYSMEEQKGHARVYTVGGGWRYVGFNGRRAANRFKDSPGIYANGALYWLYHSTKVHESEIVAFDLEGEKVHYFPLPRSKDFEYEKSISPLKLLGGNDKLSLLHRNNTASCTDIWVYQKNNMSAGTCCATKEFSIQSSLFGIDPFAITRSNEVLMWLLCMRLGCYDPKTSTLSILWENEAINADSAGYVYIEAIPHMQSIVSMKDLGESNVISLKDFGQAMNFQERKKNC